MLINGYITCGRLATLRTSGSVAVPMRLCSPFNFYNESLWNNNKLSVNFGLGVELTSSLVVGKEGNLWNEPDTTVKYRYQVTNKQKVRFIQSDGVLGEETYSPTHRIFKPRDQCAWTMIRHSALGQHVDLDRIENVLLLTRAGPTGHCDIFHPTDTLAVAYMQNGTFHTVGNASALDVHGEPLLVETIGENDQRKYKWRSGVTPLMVVTYAHIFDKSRLHCVLFDEATKSVDTIKLLFPTAAIVDYPDIRDCEDITTLERTLGTKNIRSKRVYEKLLIVTGAKELCKHYVEDFVIDHQSSKVETDYQLVYLLDQFIDLEEIQKLLKDLALVNEIPVIKENVDVNW